jgi:hypothetical protein
MTKSPNRDNNLLPLLKGKSAAPALAQRVVWMPAKARVWRRILAERSIPAIWYGDAHPGRSWHFLRDGHWNAQGHRWAAELIAGYLFKRQDMMSSARMLETGVPTDSQ